MLASKHQRCHGQIQAGSRVAPGAAFVCVPFKPFPQDVTLAPWQWGVCLTDTGDFHIPLSTRIHGTDISVYSNFVNKITTTTDPSQLPCCKPKYLLTFKLIKSCYSPSNLKNQNTNKPGNSDVNACTLSLLKQNIILLKTLKNILP